MKKLVIFLFAILIFSGVAAAQQRPQCFEWKGVGACFIELAGAGWRIAGWTDDGMLEATWISKNNDWIRGNPAKATFHLSDADVDLTFKPPSACDSFPQGSCDETKFYHGKGKISLNGPLFFGSCPDTLNIMGDVQNPSGDWFRAQYLVVVTKSQTEGCTIAFEKLTVTPK